MPRLSKVETPAKQVAGFIAKFDPAIAKLTRGARAKMRKRLPTAVELVYDNYNALAIGFGPTERIYDRFILLKCTSAYPTTESEANILTNHDMHLRYDCEVGL